MDRGIAPERVTDMATKFYGNIMNRLEEGKQFCGEITVGTGMTEYSWSDRDAYEVTAVRDQKHVTVRRLDYKAKNPGAMDNEWELYSNPENPECDMVKVGDVWYWTVTVTAEEWAQAKAQMDAGEIEWALSIVRNGFDPDKIMAKGKQTKRTKANVSFGVARYYYDYEF